MHNMNLDDMEFIRRCYRVLMDREPEGNATKRTGMYWWYDNMNVYGWSKREVLQGFVESTEFSNICRDYGIIRGDIDFNAEYLPGK